MSFWKGVRVRLRSWLRAGRVDSELDEELGFHVAMETEKYMRAGLSSADARRKALLLLGGRDRARELHRDVRGLRVIERVLRDIRHAVRGLVAKRDFTLAAAFTLAVGIGANVTAFSVVHALLFRPPSGIGDPESLFRVRLLSPQPDGEGETTYRPVWTSYPEYEDLRDRSDAFEPLAAYRYRTGIFGRGEAATEIATVAVSGNYFQALRAEPLIGRFPSAQEDRTAENVAVLGYEFWQREFGGEAEVLGRTIELSGQSLVIVGVAARHFRGTDLDRVDVWVPLAVDARLSSPGVLDARNTYWLWLLGRLPAGSMEETAEARASAVLGALRSEHQRLTLSERADLVPVTDRFATGRDNPVPSWLLGVTAIVLLIACANVANLLLARGTGRRREFAIRAALGASRGRIVQELLTESLVLALIACGAGLVLVLMGARLLPVLDLPPLDPLIDARVLGFSLAVATLTSVLVGLVPALRSTRADVEGELKAATPRATFDRSRIRAALTMGQVALSIALLVNAGLFVRSLRNVRSIDASMDVDNLQVILLRFPSGTDPERVLGVKEAAVDRMRAMPEVVSADLGTGASFTSGLGQRRIDPTGFGLPDETLLYAVAVQAGPDYFRTVSLGLRAGRTFDTDDRAGGNPVAIVNAAFTRMIGVSDRDILGRCIPWRVDRCVEIVGVVEDTRFFDAIEEPQPAIYTAIAQEQRDQATAQALILARTAGTTSQIAATIRHELQLLAPELRYVDVQSMADLLRPTLQPWRIATVIFTLFGAVAFLLAAVGLYSVIAYLVEARSAEMGIRMALGAGQARIAQMVVAEGIRLAGYGVVLGLGLAVWSSQLLKNRFFGVQPIDPPTYVSVIILMVSIAVAASLISALRATKIDPNVALKSDGTTIVPSFQSIQSSL